MVNYKATLLPSLFTKNIVVLDGIEIWYR